MPPPNSPSSPLLNPRSDLSPWVADFFLSYDLRGSGVEAVVEAVIVVVVIAVADEKEEEIESKVSRTPLVKIMEMVMRVLPKPISSARMPPFTYHNFYNTINEKQEREIYRLKFRGMIKIKKKECKKHSFVSGIDK